MVDRPDGSHICSCGDCSPGFEDTCKYEGLARELYEALKELDRGLVGTARPVTVPEALAHYEKEVGRVGGRDHDDPIGPVQPIKSHGTVNVGLTARGTLVVLDPGKPASLIYKKEVAP